MHPTHGVHVLAAGYMISIAVHPVDTPMTIFQISFHRFMLRIDTSGWGVNFDALFDEACRNCSLRDHYISYIIR